MRSSSKAMLCSKLAIATALVVGATPAAAQFAGTIGGGSTGINLGSSTSSTINVTGTQAVVDWTATGLPGGGQVTFLDTGNSVTFQSDNNFAVLNRVNASGNAIFMDGTINSLVGPTGQQQTGGTVYFYSANGIVMGSNSVINVGSLGLTTSPIAIDGNGNWVAGFGTASPTVTFGNSAVGSYIRTDPGSQLNANGVGNYVALVSPRVEHQGIIRTDGGAALVAATGATITFRTDSLFDIVVTAGSSDSAQNGIVVDGGTIEANSTDVTSGHRAYLVAVPANTAMTMLIQGGASLGFDPADSVSVDGNAVVLSAGRNIFNGEDVGPPNVPASSITIDNAAFTSNVTAYASDTILINSSAGTTSFSGSLNAAATSKLYVQATQNLLSIAGNLTATADNVGDDAVGGDVRIGAANGATMTVGGNVSLSAGGFGFSAIASGANAGHGTGGSVLVQAASGGTLSIAGTLSAAADGLGGNHGFSNGAGGIGTGGLVQILANDSESSVTVAQATTLSATGIGGSKIGCPTCSIVSGGDGKGGLIDVNGALGSGISLTFGGSVTLNVDGQGGTGDAGAGDALGGSANVSSADGTVINIAGKLAITAEGRGGANLGSGAAGDGEGGDALLGGFNAPGGSITVGGGVELVASGTGGNASGSGAGGIGTGGNASINAPGVTLSLSSNPDIFGEIELTADGAGGNSSSGAGGKGLGGDALIRANGTSLTINADARLSAIAEGGDGLVGGDAEGGLAEMTADGTTLTVTGTATQYAYANAGDGGFGVGGVGGFGDGGQSRVTASNNGTVALYSLDSNASARGGDGATGGAALGGNINIVTLSGGDIDVDYQLYATTNGRGGYGNTGFGGVGEGGITHMLADNGTIQIDDLVDLSASGFGGSTGGAAAMRGGLGDGGIVVAGAANGGTLTALSSFRADASARGGEAFTPGAIGGNGFGGTVDFRASGTNSTINARFSVSLDASGEGGGGACGDCSGGGGGGLGVGGLAIMQTYGGLGNRILLGDIELAANGSGGDGTVGAGGNGIAGDALVGVSDNALIDVDGDLTLSAIGDGGDQNNGGTAGNGVGGDAAIRLIGTAAAKLEVGGETRLDSEGRGGSSFGSGGTAGNGTGGFARVAGTGGTTDFTGPVSILASGIGGIAAGGTGGNGVGGQAWVNSTGATLGFAGNLSLVAQSRGGDGTNGGDALAFIGDVPRDQATTDARILAANGSVTVLGATSLDVSATGGSGAEGGAGGNASSGFATIHALNSDLGPATITLGNVAIDASVTGGAGGTGTSGGVGGNGGAGGFATGGFIAPTASAGNGRLILGNTVIDGTATGGAGGWGGNGDGGAGGNGGIGGAATGASLYIGTENGENAALGINQGSASFASINSVLDAVGGSGGWGASGTTNGVGGAGGAAQGGDGYLSSRGALVTVGGVTFTGHATGGAGGLDPFESSSGVGGNATAGGIGIGAINRTGNVAMRGSINAGAVSMSATATGGSGSTDGLGYAGGRNYFVVVNSNATFASVAMLNQGSSGADPDAVLDPIFVASGTASVLGDFTVVNPALVSLMMDSGSLTAGGDLSITAGNFIHDIFNPAPTNLGTVSGGTITLTSLQDVIVDAHLVGSGDVLLDALGLIDAHNLTTAGGDVAGDITLLAGSTIDALTVNADGGVDVVAGGNVTLGDVTGYPIEITSTGGSVDTGHLTSTGFYVAVNAFGAIDADNVAGGSVDLVAGGYINVDDVDGAVDHATLKAGGNLTAVAVSSNGDVTLIAGGNILTGAVSSDNSSILANATGNAQFLGALTAGNNITLTTGGTLSGGAVDAGGALTATSIGVLNLGNIDALTAAISGLSVTLGSVNLTGLFDAQSDSFFLSEDITTGESLVIDVVGNITTQAITTPGGIFLGAGENISTGALSGGDVDFVAVGNIGVVGDASVAETFSLEAGGTINAASVTAGNSIEFEAAGAVVVTGNLSAGLINPSNNEFAEYNVGVVSATSVSLGNVEARGWVGIGTFGTVAVNGSIASGDDVLILADGNITSGAITTGDQNRLLIAGADMVGVGGGVDDFDRSIVFNAVDLGNGIPTVGSVTISGPVNTLQLDILAGTNVSVGDMNLGFGDIDAGGLLTLNGDITGEVHLTSNDIVVANGVTAEAAQLVSRNSQGTFIGDGLSGTGGYRLSSAEYNSFGELDVAADLALGAGSTMTIGDLTVANFGTGERDFSVIDGDGEGPGAGTIRVVGDVRFTGITIDGEGGVGTVDFTARRFQVDAGTGSISLENGSGGLAGVLEIEAQHVHVAEGEILDKLVLEPDYAGLAVDLKTPPVTAAPGGVVRAGEIYVYLDDGTQVAQDIGTNAVSTYSVYVQNTGTAANRAGFVANYAEIVTPFGTPAGAVDMIVNGQLVVDGATLTGVAVRDALMEEDDPARFTATSTINGCPLTGACILLQDPPPINPTPDIQTQFSLINLPTGDDLLFGNEETIEDNEEDGGEDSASSPIQPPTPLFNTKPLEVAGDTDEPVSGGGNPALIGNGENPDDDDDDEEDE